jgi:hypothetical protein
MKISVEKTSARGRSARRSHAPCAIARVPAITNPVINDNASIDATIHRNHIAV